MFYSLAPDAKLKQPSLFKVICLKNDEGKEKVLGVHAIGKGVDEMMQAISVGINLGMTK